MNKIWFDPVKGQPASPETLAIEGSFEKFTTDMKRIMRPVKTEKQKPTSASASPGPVASS